MTQSRTTESEYYEKLVERADALWERYIGKKAELNQPAIEDSAAFAAALAQLHVEVAALHREWMEVRATESMIGLDLKVGLALELQLAAVHAVLVALMDDDPVYMGLSNTLDDKYTKVVDSI